MWGENSALSGVIVGKGMVAPGSLTSGCVRRCRIGGLLTRLHGMGTRLRTCGVGCTIRIRSRTDGGMGRIMSGVDGLFSGHPLQ